MKLLLVVLLATLFLAADGQYCYKDVTLACAKDEFTNELAKLQSCNARYGAMNGTQQHSHSMDHHLQKYAMANIRRSFEYLLTSTHFANVQNNRDGFSGAFKSLSDSAWADGLAVIKFIAKRGGEMVFHPHVDHQQSKKVGKLEASELASLGRALDTQKLLAKEAFSIHELAMRRQAEEHDADVVHFVEEHFVHQQADRIRSLAGHVTDVGAFFASPDTSLALYLFDRYLQKLY